MRVIAVCADGPKSGLEITLVGQSATETMMVAEWWKPPIDLGPPHPGEQVRRATYRYVRSIPDSYAKYLHLYELDPKDRDVLWEALHPAPAWEPPDGSGQKAVPAEGGG
jgi:hypothetical protein